MPYSWKRFEVEDEMVSEYCMVMELAAGGTLLDALHDAPGGTIAEPAAQYYVACLVSALEHLHKRKTVHRDVNPQEIYLDDRRRPR